MSLNVRNNTEALLWDSIDALINELDEVALAGVKLGVKPEEVADYIHAEAHTVVNRLRVGVSREFDAIYSDFIDEVVANGKYDDFVDFLKFRASV